MKVMEVVQEIEVSESFKNPATGEETTTVKFRKGRAGDLKVMDGKGEQEGMICLAAALTNLTPRIVENFPLEDYAKVMSGVRSFLEPLKRAAAAS